MTRRRPQLGQYQTGNQAGQPMYTGDRFLWWLQQIYSEGILKGGDSQVNRRGAISGYSCEENSIFWTSFKRRSLVHYKAHICPNLNNILRYSNKYYTNNWKYSVMVLPSLWWAQFSIYNIHNSLMTKHSISHHWIPTHHILSHFSSQELTVLPQCWIAQ